MRIRVINPPAKPTLIWDGDCHFCRRWIERWRTVTGDKVDYVASQEVGERFPEISRDEFQRSIVYIDANGDASFAAEAACRSLGCGPSRKWLAWSYDHVPGFAAIAEAGYKIIARNRRLASALTQLLWGDDVRPPTYARAAKWFLRVLGIVYLIAFISLWVQIDGLVGSNGILPIADWLATAHEQVGSRAIWLLPTLCWLNPGDAFLHLLCGGGVVLSILLMLRIAPAISLGGLFIFYLSLMIGGQTFLSFQWDILLLETGFLSIFVAPWKLWPGTEHNPSRTSVFLLKMLLFKLMLMSGVVKLTSGDDSWFNLTALDYHYWSQPLPTVFAWWADKNAEWLKQLSVAICLFIEIVVPLFIWAPRRPRLVAAGFLIFLQVAIAITGNYCFFNSLTAALCLLLIDDSAWRRQRGVLHEGTRAVVSHSFAHRLSIGAALVVLIVTFPINAWLVYSAFEPEADMPAAIRFGYERLDRFRIVSGYGLFRVMTKDRREIILEASADGIEWVPYEFKWKPGDVNRAPGWCAPHQPRLDWQMWFAALSSARQNDWFVRLAFRLLENKPEVVKLLAHNPFPNEPPHYIRATFYRYRFATAEEHRQTGAWWTRSELGEYLPTISLQSLQQ